MTEDRLQKNLQRLERERDILQDIFEAVPVALLLINENINVVQVNNVATRMVYKEAVKLLNRQPGDSLGCVNALNCSEGCGHGPACSKCSIRGTVEQVLRTGVAVNDVEVEQRLMLSEGERRFWFSINGTTLTLNGKRHALLALTDITHRKQTEEEMLNSKQELEQTAHRLEYILGATGTGIDIVDGDFNLHYVDRLWQSVYGDPEGRKCYEYFKNRKAPCENCGIPVALETGKVTVREQVLPKEDNRIVEVQSIPYQNQKGDWLVAEFKIDITDRKQAEEKLRERDEQLNKVITAAQDAIIMMDPQGNISMWNDSSERIFGYTVTEAIGQNLHDLLAPSRYHIEQTKAFKEFCRSGTGNAVGKLVELTALRKNGEEFPVELSLSAVYLKGGWHSIGVLRDITERKQAEAALRETNLQLAEAKEKAEAANRAKSEFLANMSHEIRTPMNVIIGMSDLLCNTELSTEQLEFAGMVKESADSLLTIINDILDFSKVEAGRLELEHSSFNLTSLVEKTLSPLALRAHAKSLELLFYIKDDVPPFILGDPNRLKQVLINLLGNAIKFTETGEVVLTVEKMEESHLAFSIKDTGSGIPADKQGLLFQNFSQVDSSSTRKYEGTGLGLAISKKLVELMGGTISVISKVGQGSTFSFTIPLTLPVNREFFADQEIAPTFADLENLKVLVIDDNRANRMIVEKMLNRWGIIVKTAPGGREGLKILQESVEQDTPFDLVLLDQQMPELDGFQVAELVRGTKDLNSVLMMMLSSVDMQHSTARCRETGLDGYMVKPVKQSDLLNKIYDLLYGSNQQRMPQTPAPLTAIREKEERVLQVLLVEDKPMNRKLATVLLEKKGWNVTPAHNGRHALEILASRTFDVVLMDVQMPEMDGQEATRQIRLRENEMGGHIPIIAMTAHAMQGDREKCLEAGMDSYVSKPINPEELYLAVEQVVDAVGQTGMDASLGEERKKSLYSQSEMVQEVTAMLENLGGDKALLAEMVQLLLEDTFRELTQLGELLTVRDKENAALVAHGLKGELENLGMNKALAISQNLEKSIRENRFAEGISYLQILQNELRELENFFVRRDWQKML